jgi:F420-dependent oxidoreductase-like protein
MGSSIRVGLSVVLSSPTDADLVVQAERLGADSVWVPEAWGYDALTPLAYLAARTTRIRLASGIVQVGARTPAMLAMQSMSLQAISGGRFVLGLGTSGPRVMEAWHGIPFTSPLTALRETIEIVRQIARGDRLEHAGHVYVLPREGAGRPIRSMAPPADIPVYVASLGPRSLELTGELADGWLGNAFMPEQADVFLDPMRIGCERAGRSLEEIDLVMPVAVEFTDDAEAAARRHANGYAFTIGAMGTGDQNFYNRAFTRQGYGDDVEAVSRLWNEGKRDEAAARVPIDIGMKTNLLGTAEMIADRVRLYRDAGITTLQAKLSGLPHEKLHTLARLIEVVDEVDEER